MKEDYFERLIKRHGLEEMHYKQSTGGSRFQSGSKEFAKEETGGASTTDDTVPAIQSYGFKH